MVSNRQLAANRRNALLSRGPQTQEGKLRSRANAFRHGLAIPISDNPAVAVEIERLAKQLAGFSNDFWRNERARTIAECFFDLQRIRAVRTEVLRRIGDLETATADEHALAVATIEKIYRYEFRALSRRKNALREWMSNREDTVSG